MAFHFFHARLPSTDVVVIAFARKSAQNREQKRAEYFLDRLWVRWEVFTYQPSRENVKKKKVRNVITERINFFGRALIFSRSRFMSQSFFVHDIRTTFPHVACNILEC